MSWCDYMVNESSHPLLYKHNHLAIKEYCDNNTSQTPYDLFWSAILLGGASHSSKFKQVSIGHTNISTSHDGHPGFQHEWWSLKGVLNDAPYYWCYWKQQLYPDKEEYVIRTIECIGQNEPKENYWLSNHSDVVGFTSLQPKQGLFPVKFATDSITIDPIQSDKPFMLPNSTACSNCSNGVGRKMVTFPLCTAPGFIGSWQHIWTSSEFNSKEAQSVMLRSFDIIQNQIKPLIPVQELRCDFIIGELYFQVTFHLNDINDQGWYVSTTGKYMDKYRSINSLTFHMRKDENTIYFESSQFIFTFQIKHRIDVVGLSQEYGIIRGWLNSNDTLQGFGWMETVQTPTHERKPDNVPIIDMSHPKKDIVVAYVLWCIPLVLTIILFAMVFALPSILQYMPNPSSRKSILHDPIPY